MGEYYLIYLGSIRKFPIFLFALLAKKSKISGAVFGIQGYFQNEN